MIKGILVVCSAASVAMLLAGCQGQTRVSNVPSSDLSRISPSEPPRFREISIASQDRRIPVLMYHNVVAKRGPNSPWFDYTTKQFVDDLNWIESHGWQPISIDDFYAHLSEGKPVPDRSVLLTFDDNYQGFYDNAYPILKQRRFPSVMFVHTKFVGNQENTPKMSWDELKSLVKEGLVAIGSHTVSHPEDISMLPSEEQKRELVDSKKELEAKLGIEVRYLAYPDGKNSFFTQMEAKEAGYKLAFSTESGLAEESPNILCVNRYIANKLQEACAKAESAMADAPAAVAQIPLQDSPLEVINGRFDGRKLTMIAGGLPKTWLSAGRFPVGKIISMSGAKAGINGGYFALSAISSDDDQMIGPCLSSNQKIFKEDHYQPRLPKLLNRPLVLIGPSKMVIAPFQAGTMNKEDLIKAYLPDVTDVFMAGAWFVHNGVARQWNELRTYVAKDVNDFRRRAFFGAMRDGRVVVGAAIDSVTTEQLGKSLVAAGVQEAVLLDSGFSTSLVFGDQILASGHSTADEPSRPVPHTILLYSSLTPPAENDSVLKAIAEERRTASQGGGRRRARRHR